MRTRRRFSREGISRSNGEGGAFLSDSRNCLAAVSAGAERTRPHKAVAGRDEIELIAVAVEPERLLPATSRKRSPRGWLQHSAPVQSEAARAPRADYQSQL